MQRHLPGSLPAAAALLAAAVLVAVDSSATIIINNGLAPPDPANVFTTDDPLENLLVTDLGCDDQGCPMLGVATTVEYAAGAHVETVDVSGTSRLVMTGGLTDHAGADADARLEILGGASVDLSAGARGNASVLLDGGSVGDDFFLTDSASLVFSSGFLGQRIIASGSATALMTGGLGDGFFAADDSRIVWRGGQAGSLALASASGAARIVISGSGFVVDGMPFGFGTLTASSPGGQGPGAGSVSGILASGEPFSIDYGILDSAAIVLAPVPEPALATLLGVAMLALALTPAARGRSAR